MITSLSYMATDSGGCVICPSRAWRLLFHEFAQECGDARNHQRAPEDATAEPIWQRESPDGKAPNLRRMLLEPDFACFAISHALILTTGAERFVCPSPSKPVRFLSKQLL